jgi:hypothetical protein
MSEHTWIVEYVDGGPVDGDFWTCSVCGTAGGPCFYPSQETKPRWAPFLSGPAMKVSTDCDEARKEIRAYIDGRIAALAKMGSKGISPHYASLLRDALVWTPGKTDITDIVPFFWEIETFHGRPSVMDVREKLQKAGFNVMPQAVSEALDE